MALAAAGHLLDAVAGEVVVERLPPHLAQDDDDGERDDEDDADDRHSHYRYHLVAGCKGEVESRLESALGQLPFNCERESRKGKRPRFCKTTHFSMQFSLHSSNIYFSATVSITPLPYSISTIPSLKLAIKTYENV